LASSIILFHSKCPYGIVNSIRGLAVLSLSFLLVSWFKPVPPP